MYSKTIIIGHLGKDPEMRYTPKGTAATKFSVAVNSGSGKYERTDWYNIQCWGNTAESTNEYLTQGSKVLVEGQMEHDRWTDDNGEEHEMWKLNANRVKFLDRKEDRPQQSSDDLPF